MTPEQIREHAAAPAAGREGTHYYGDGCPQHAFDDASLTRREAAALDEADNLRDQLNRANTERARLAQELADTATTRACSGSSCCAQDALGEMYRLAEDLFAAAMAHVTVVGDAHWLWLSCGLCGVRVCSVEVGDSLDSLVRTVAQHRCGAEKE